MGHKPRTLNTQLTTENWIQTTLVPELFVIINALASTSHPLMASIQQM